MDPQQGALHADLYDVTGEPRPCLAGDDTLGYHAAELILQTDPRTRAEVAALREKDANAGRSAHGAAPTDTNTEAARDVTEATD